MDLNKVMLIGRIASDLDIKKIPESGNSVLNFSLATNRRYTNKEGNIVEESEFHRCVAYGKQADTLGQYMSKGKKLFIEGRLRTRKWEDSQGNTRYTTEIIIENFIFLDSKATQGDISTTEEQPVNNTETTPEEELPF